MSRVRAKKCSMLGMGWVFESHLKIVAQLGEYLADYGPEMTCDWKMTKPPGGFRLHTTFPETRWV
jgi:hypothetical protein